MDKTLIAENSGSLFMRYRYARGEIGGMDLVRGLGAYLQYKLGVLDIRNWTKNMMLQFRGRSEAELERRRSPGATTWWPAPSIPRRSGWCASTTPRATSSRSSPAPSEVRGQATNGNTKCYNWGAYLGNRYKGYSNIIWMIGNDFQDWSTDAGKVAADINVFNGIQSADSNHTLFTAWLDYYVSASRQSTDFDAECTLNLAYTYYVAYDLVATEYARTPAKPFSWAKRITRIIPH